MEKNYGLLLNEPRPKDFRFGAFTVLPKDVLVDDGNWSAYLPVYEAQLLPKFDTMACVTFSALNCLETLIKRKYNREENFSDRFTATMSGTTREGNFVYKVADSIRNDGVVSEMDWPTLSGFTFDDYYSLITPEIKETGQQSKEKYNFAYEYVEKKDFIELLRYSPLQVGIKAYGVTVDGVYQKIDGSANHMVTLYQAKENEHWLIYDHYDKAFKPLAWDYLFPFAVRWDVQMVEKTPMTIPQNALIQLVEHPGGFGMFLNGKIIVDDFDKLQLSWVMRNTDFGNKICLTKEQWNKYPKCNLKGEPVI